MRKPEHSIAGWVAAVSAAGAALLGALGLAGWPLGLAILTSVSPRYRAIAPSAAVALIVLGLLLAALVSGGLGRRARAAAALAAALVSVYGLLDLVGFLVSADLNREDALTQYLARVWSFPFTPLSPVAAVTMFLTGAAIVALLLRPRAGRGRGMGDAAGGLGAAVVAVALVFVLSYVYGVPLLYGSSVLPIAATSALGFLLLGVGAVAAAGPKQWPLRSFAGGGVRARLLRVFVPLTVLVVLVSSIGYERAPALAELNRALEASVAAVIFAAIAGVVVSRVAGVIGDAIERAQAAQRESEERLRLAQQVAGIGTFEWNMRSGVNTWTPEMEAMYGLPPGGFPRTQEAWEHLVHPEDREEMRRRLAAATESGSFEGEWRVIWPDGTVHWLTGRAWVFQDESGRPLRLIGANIDITERKQAEQERERLQAELLTTERARAELAEALNAEISHRTKNNLAMVTSILQMQGMDQQDERVAAILQATAARVLTFANIHEQLQTSQTGEVDLLAAVSRIADATREVLGLGEVEFSVEGEPAPMHARVATNLAVVANELITNAAKHGAPGADGRCHVRAHLGWENGQFHLSVWNSGRPVPEDFGLDRATGMGLRLVRTLIVDQYGGSFTLRPSGDGNLAEAIVPESKLR